jgi:hypothetical protein
MLGMETGQVGAQGTRPATNRVTGGRQPTRSLQHTSTTAASIAAMNSVSDITCCSTCTW